MYSADPLSLRHDMELSDWKLDPVIAPDAFTSQEAVGSAFAHVSAGGGAAPCPRLPDFHTGSTSTTPATLPNSRYCSAVLVAKRCMTRAMLPVQPV
jgi:hypothetical protein